MPPPEPPEPPSNPWREALDALVGWIAANGWNPARVVVLVPYAQLMDAGRQAWVERQPGGFVPRFETTRNWSANLAPFLPGPTDVSGDTARDSLIAASLLDSTSGHRRPDASLRGTLVRRLVEAARQLALVAAARPPDARAEWADGCRAVLSSGSLAMQWEGLVASLALTWSGLSSYATDALWSRLAEPGQVADGLAVLPGFQTDPLAVALLERWDSRATRLPWQEESPALPLAEGGPNLHACADADDEAQRAAACVLSELEAGHAPVALVAQDRALTRRIGALLQGAGVQTRDETGWKLSTTHAAARLMALLRAADPRARTDDVLDWLKAGPHALAADALERPLRRLRLGAWRAVLRHPVTAPLVPDEASALLVALQQPRALPLWLDDLAKALHSDGWWTTFAADEAGQRVIDALRLQAGASVELAQLAQGNEGMTGAGQGGRRWPLAVFTAWLRDVLEAGSFQPGGAGPAEVVVLPMAQLLGRRFGATVAPGCDERSLPASPEPEGPWSEAQRSQLGLAGRSALTEAARASWAHLLRQRRLHLLWRTEQQGETVLPAPCVQTLQASAQPAVDPRRGRWLPALPAAAPQPRATALLPTALSASAYQDLRQCPYRFFALRALRLQEAEELESEPDKRDLGIWLHAVLKAFHEQRAHEASVAHRRATDRERIDAIASALAQERGLAPEPAAGGRAGGGVAGSVSGGVGGGVGGGAVGVGGGAADFLPYLAAWPAIRDGYLHWLAKHEAAGPVFERAEVSLSRPLGPWKLVGQLDRIDRQPSPEGPLAMVIDYKTEPRDVTRKRIKEPLEDTQIAFYAALLGDETVRGGYLSITDSREGSGSDAPTHLLEQTEIEPARDQLLANIAQDLGRIASGHPLPALGEGSVCDHCAARGLCRKDFWA